MLGRREADGGSSNGLTDDPSPAVTFLEGTTAEPANERATAARAPNLKPLAAIAAVVAAVAVVAAISGRLGSGDGEPSATTDPPTEEAAPDPSTETASVDTAPVDTGRLGNTGPAQGASQPRVLGAFGLAAGETLPESVPPAPIPTDLVAIGHSSERRLARVDPDGAVAELLPGDGTRFVPLVSSRSSVAGFFTFTGDMGVVTADGERFSVEVDLTTGPALFAAADGRGFVLFLSSFGTVTRLDELGAFLRSGPTLPSGSRLVADTISGLLVELPDRSHVVLDDEGEVVARIDGDVLAAAGDTVVAISCPTPDACRVEARRLSDPTATVDLGLEPSTAHRLVVSLSDEGGYLAVQSRNDLVLLSTTSGSEAQRFAGHGRSSLSWHGDRLVVVHPIDDNPLGPIESEAAPAVAPVLWQPGNEPVVLDLEPAIAPGFRGIHLLCASLCE